MDKVRVRWPINSRTFRQMGLIFRPVGGNSMGWGFDGMGAGAPTTRSALGGSCFAWGQSPHGPHSRTRPAIGGRSPHSRTPVRPVRPSWARGSLATPGHRGGCVAVGATPPCKATATSHRARWGSMATPGHRGGRGPKGHRGGKDPHNPFDAWGQGPPQPNTGEAWRGVSYGPSQGAQSLPRRPMKRAF